MKKLYSIINDEIFDVAELKKGFYENIKIIELKFLENCWAVTKVMVCDIDIKEKGKFVFSYIYNNENKNIKIDIGSNNAISSKHLNWIKGL